MRVNEFGHGYERIEQESLVEPEINLFSFFNALQHTSLLEDAQMMGHRRAAEGRDFDDLTDIEPLAGTERQQYPLPVLVTQRRKHLG